MYMGHGELEEVILTFAEDHELDLEDFPTHVELPQNTILAPLAPASVVVHGPGAVDHCHRGVYGRFPNGTVVVILVGQTFSLESLVDGGYNVRVILDPYMEDDEYVVDNIFVIF